MGSQAAEILAERGMSEDQIQRLVDANVVCPADRLPQLTKLT